MIIKNRSRKNELYKKVYKLQYNMMRRCYNSNDPSYKNYGAKGVTVSERWHSLDNLIEDIDSIKGFDINLFLEGKLYLDKDTHDLSNKIYCLDKCEFVSPQVSNSRKQNQQIHFIATSPTGETFKSYNQCAFAKKHNLRQSTISDCLKGRIKKHRGWMFEHGK